MMTLSHNIYEEQEDRHAAISILQNIIASGRRGREQIDTSHSTQPVPAATASASPRSSSVEKIAHNVAMRLRDKDKTFSGAIGECWMEYVDEYKQVPKDYSLDPTQRLQYMHNLLSGDGKRFFLGKVEGYAPDFNQVVGIVEKEYNSAVRQTKVNSFLNTLRISKFISKGAETSEALAKVHNVMNKLAR